MGNAYVPHHIDEPENEPVELDDWVMLDSEMRTVALVQATASLAGPLFRSNEEILERARAFYEFLTGDLSQPENNGNMKLS